MYPITILTNDRPLGRCLRGWTRDSLAGRGLFPRLDVPEDLEAFYYRLRASPAELVVVALPGVAGLNAAEHLHALCPDCGLIWCSDLDFSLQAYRLNAVYFILGPPTEAELNTGLTRWLESREVKKDRSML